VIWHCCKNNDGELGCSTVWERGNGIFKPVENFDWSELNSNCEKRKTVTETELAALFDNGSRNLTRKHAIQCLQDQTGCKQSTAYNALKQNGRFASHLMEDQNGLLSWKP
jgi:hypothetical protein